MLNDFIQQFTKEDILEGHNIKEIEHRFYAAPPTTYTHDPSYEGIFLGEKVKGKFKPSFILLDMVKPHAKNKIHVDDKQAWLFLCKRDIMDVEADMKDKTLTLVLNRHDEVLGYGVYWSEGKVAVKNILDRGDFLRRER